MIPLVSFKSHAVTLFYFANEEKIGHSLEEAIWSIRISSLFRFVHKGINERFCFIRNHISK